MDTPQHRKWLLHQQLQALNPQWLEIIDESHLHWGHPGAQGGASHFALTIVSAHFNGLSPVQRHRMIYQLVVGLIPSKVHALKITARTPTEHTQAK